LPLPKGLSKRLVWRNRLCWRDLPSLGADSLLEHAGPRQKPLPAAASMLLLRRPRAAVGSWARALCTPASAHLAVLQLYRLQPAPVPPGLQPRLLFADGQARSAEESAARLAEASDRGEVVLVTESALRQLLGGEAEDGQQALSGEGGGGAGLLAGGLGGGPGAAVTRSEAAAEATLPAVLSQETLPALLAQHGVALKDRTLTLSQP
jgi:hypothetical protein